MYCDNKPTKGETKERMRVEAVIVCVNYSDFLAHTLPHNKHYLDKIVVVTDMKDTKTKRLCDFYEVECLQTDVFYEDGAVFNKAKGINVGLATLKRNAWVLHLDADIWLSPHTRIVLNARHFDKEAIYGIDRLMCHSYEEWMSFIESPKAINELYYLVQARAFPIGSRVAHYNQLDGWFPIGFFQLWNPTVSSIHSYPTEGVAADHTDVLMSKQFPVGKRHLIAETYVIHIDSERNKEMGLNWNGRKSRWFGPSKEKKEHGRIDNRSL